VIKNIQCTAQLARERAHLEYCSEIWRPHYAKDKKLIEVACRVEPSDL